MERDTLARVFGWVWRMLARPRRRTSLAAPTVGRGIAPYASAIALLLCGFSTQAAALSSNDCLFTWAEGQYPSLFVPSASPTLVAGGYTYRYYAKSKTYLGISAADKHVYYIGPDGQWQDQGAVSDWLPKANCPAPAPPQIDCLFDWAERSYSGLFLPTGVPTTISDVYTYRYYSASNTWLWVSSLDNHVYFMGPDGKPQDEGLLSNWLPNVACQNVFDKPAFPVIFIHGLNSSAQAWAEPGSSLKDFLINNGGWTFGGSPAYDTNTKTVNGILGTGDFYTLDFSGNPYFGLALQGGELSAIIKAVLSNNPGKGKVILVAHSLGGLVAREYLQGLSTDFSNLQSIPYQGDVAKLITVGTPHQGTDIADTCLQYRIICDWLGYDASSQAISDLRLGSLAINTLNDLQTHPLPATIAYYSILGSGADTMTSLYPPRFEDGDFIVTLTSQNLSKLNGTATLYPKTVTLDIVSRSACEYQGIVVPHRCEPADPGVWEAILLDL